MLFLKTRESLVYITDLTKVFSECQYFRIFSKELIKEFVQYFITIDHRSISIEYCFLFFYVQYALWPFTIEECIVQALVFFQQIIIVITRPERSIIIACNVECKAQCF